jgi:putative ABC transport system ATP-binding protein
MTTAVRMENLSKDYHLGSGTVHALRNVSLDISQGELLAIMGTSGSGKSTLLNLLGCLDRPTAGRLLLGSDDISRLGDDQLSEIRASRIGFVFQSFNLIQQLTVMENIQVPLYYQGRMARQANERCRQLAEMVGLGDRLQHRPSQLSGGQQQRVAVARSLANDPQIILADEPTGNLDSSTTDDILTLLQRLNREGKTIIVVTHEDEVARRARRIVRLKDGMVESDTLQE